MTLPLIIQPATSDERSRLRHIIVELQDYERRRHATRLPGGLIAEACLASMLLRADADGAAVVTVLALEPPWAARLSPIHTCRAALPRICLWLTLTRPLCSAGLGVATRTARRAMVTLIATDQHRMYTDGVSIGAVSYGATE